MRPSRILVVADEASNRTLLRRVLESVGYSVEEASDGDEAIAAAARDLPDLLILDFDMPKLLGPEVSALLKSGTEPRSIPVIFLSGMTDEDHHAIGAFSGAAAYLDKPVDERQLVETIRALLGHQGPSA